MINLVLCVIFSILLIFFSITNYKYAGELFRTDKLIFAILMFADVLYLSFYIYFIVEFLIKGVPFAW